MDSDDLSRNVVLMRIFKITTLITLCVSLLWSCDRLKLFSSDGEVIARVGDKELYLKDVTPIFTAGITPQDSIKLLESYVDVWVKRQLKTMEAEKLFRESGEDIDKMVADYRNSLLNNRLDMLYVDNRIDTLYTYEEITGYYNDHKADFTLDRTIVKGRIAKLHGNLRQRNKVKELINTTGDKYKDFMELSRKNKIEVKEFDQWTNWSDFVANLPSVAGANEKDLLSGGVKELKDGDDMYYIYVSDVRRSGESNPQERVTDVIKRVLYNQRRQELIRHYEDSLYKEAVAGGVIDIKVEQ